MSQQGSSLDKKPTLSCKRQPKKRNSKKRFLPRIVDSSVVKKFERQFGIFDSIYASIHEEMLDHVLKSMDLLSQFTKCSSCKREQRIIVFSLKNYLLKTLWKKYQKVFVGTWLHTAEYRDQKCHECNGSGSSKNDLRIICKRCEGSGKWKQTGNQILSVFAIQSTHYQTTWHIPKRSVGMLLGGDIPYSEDLIATFCWNTNDSKKVPSTISPENYEENYALVLWFLNRFS